MSETWLLVSRSLGLGLKSEDLSFAQVALRGVIIFVVSLALIRFGHKRSLARKSAFDTVFIVIYGAVLARAINGSAAFFPTIGVAAILVVLHRVLAFVAFRSQGFECLIKGRSDTLLRDGDVLREKLRAHDISEGDLNEDMHLRGHRDVAEIALARVERSGDISFIKKDR